MVLLTCLYQVKKVSDLVYVWLMITAIAQCITKKEETRTITVFWNICLNMSSINIDYSDHTHILCFNVIKNIMSLTEFIWWDTVDWFSNWLCSAQRSRNYLGEKKLSKEFRNWKKTLIELVTGIQENVSKVSIVFLYCNIRKYLWTDEHSAGEHQLHYLETILFKHKYI